LVRRECLLKAGLFDENLGGCEDWDLLFRLAKHCRMAFTPESLITRRIHGGNLSQNEPVMTKGAMMMWDKAAEFESVKSQPKWQRLVRSHRALHHMVLGVACAEDDQRAEARVNLVNSLQISFKPRAAVHLALLLLPTRCANAIRRGIRPLRRSCRRLFI